MRIITISRQFGSGGRELGRKIAENLGWDYYDNEIIERVAEAEGMSPEYIKKTLHDRSVDSFPLSFSNSFSYIPYGSELKSGFLARQKEVLEGIAAEGRDCVIVGREADVLLKDYNPFKIYACADLKFRTERCMKREAAKGEKALSEKEVVRNIKKIDRNRSHERQLLTDDEWGDNIFYNITVNTSEWDMDALAEALSAVALKWFKD